MEYRPLIVRRPRFRIHAHSQLWHNAALFSIASFRKPARERGWRLNRVRARLRRLARARRRENPAAGVFIAAAFSIRARVPGDIRWVRENTGLPLIPPAPIPANGGGVWIITRRKSRFERDEMF